MLGKAVYYLYNFYFIWNIRTTFHLHDLFLTLHSSNKFPLFLSFKHSYIRNQTAHAASILRKYYLKFHIQVNNRLPRLSYQMGDNRSMLLQKFAYLLEKLGSFPLNPVYYTVPPPSAHAHVWMHTQTINTHLWKQLGRKSYIWM